MALLKAPERPHQRIPQCVLIARWTSRGTSNGRQGFGMNLASPGNSGGKELDVTTTSICGIALSPLLQEPRSSSFPLTLRQ